MQTTTLLTGRPKLAVQLLGWVFRVGKWLAAGVITPFAPLGIIYAATTGNFKPWLTGLHSGLWPRTTTTVGDKIYIDGLSLVVLVIGVFTVGLTMFVACRAVSQLCAALLTGESFTKANIKRWQTMLFAYAIQWVVSICLIGDIDLGALFLLLAGYVLAILFKQGVALQSDADAMI